MLHTGYLSEEDWRRLNDILDRFEVEWNTQPPPQMNDFAVAPADPIFEPLLVELTKLDQELQWKNGHRHLVETYLAAYPVLSQPRYLNELVVAEWQTRQLLGDPLTADELRGRFPSISIDQIMTKVQEHFSSRRQVRAGGDTDQQKASTSEVLSKQRLAAAARLTGKFGRYLLVKPLGIGGMGAVYLAEDPELGRRVALKIPLFDDLEALGRFKREARAVAKIEHANICHIYDIGDVDGICFIVMPYIEGPTLAAFAEKQAPLSEDEAIRIVAKIALAAQVAHDRGVVHRDLKPTNIILKDSCDPVVMDFGLARLAEAEETLTTTGRPLGTPAYMAPEQIDPVENIGPSCDIYSLGVILYELLVGRRPFTGTKTEILSQTMVSAPPPLSSFRLDLSDSIQATCFRALAKRPADRFPTMTAFAEALDPSLQCGSNIARIQNWRKVGAIISATAAAVLCLFLALTPDASLGRIRIEVSGKNAGITVQVDGTRVDVSQPLDLTTGSHRLVVTGKGIEPIERSFAVTLGENPILQIDVRPLPTAAAPVPHGVNNLASMLAAAVSSDPSPLKPLLSDEFLQRLDWGSTCDILRRLHATLGSIERVIPTTYYSEHEAVFRFLLPESRQLRTYLSVDPLSHKINKFRIAIQYAMNMPQQETRQRARSIRIDGLSHDWTGFPATRDRSDDAQGYGGLDIIATSIAPLEDKLLIMIRTAQKPSLDDFAFWLDVDFMGQEISLGDSAAIEGHINFDSHDLQFGIAKTPPHILWIKGESRIPKRKDIFEGVEVAIGEVVEVGVSYNALSQLLPDDMKALLSGTNARAWVNVSAFTSEEDEPRRRYVDFAETADSVRLIPTPWISYGQKLTLETVDGVNAGSESGGVGGAIVALSRPDQPAELECRSGKHRVVIEAWTGVIEPNEPDWYHRHTMIASSDGRPPGKARPVVNPSFVWPGNSKTPITLLVAHWPSLCRCNQTDFHVEIELKHPQTSN